MTGTLNLVPPAYKDKFRRQRLYVLLKNVALAAIGYTIVLAVVLLAARFLLQQQVTRIISETSLVTHENRQTEERIVALNDHIAVAETIQKSALPWAELLVAVSSLVPNRVTITSLKLDVDPKVRSTITGHAETRQSLQDFESRLKEAPYLKDVDLPITNFIPKEDLDFTITVTLQLDQVPPF